jgi:hypothetical protein
VGNVFNRDSSLAAFGFPLPALLKPIPDNFRHQSCPLGRDVIVVQVSIQRRDLFQIEAALDVLSFATRFLPHWSRSDTPNLAV